jgi:hypothetical protein
MSMAQNKFGTKAVAKFCKNNEVFLLFIEVHKNNFTNQIGLLKLNI